MAIRLKVETTEVKLKTAGSDAAKLKAHEGIPIYPTPYTGETEVTPTKAAQTLSTEGLMMTKDVTVNPIPSEYIIPSGTKVITENGEHDVTQHSAASVNVPIPPGYIIPSGSQTLTENDTYDITEYAEVVVDVPTPEPVLQNKTVTPSTSAQEVTADSNYDGLNKLTVNPIPSEYIIPSGTKNITANGTGIDVKAYEFANVAVPSSQPTLETVTKAYTPTTSQQTETITPSSGYDGIGEVDVTVNAMPTMTLPSNPDPTTPSGTKKATINYQVTADRYLNIPTGYNGTAQYYEIKGVPNGTVTAPSTITATGATSSVSIANQTITLTKAVSVTPSVTTAGYVSSGTAGNASVSLTASDITFRESDSLIVNGKEVTAPVGYYPAHAYASVADGTAGTPIATKGSVSNHTISVTPSVTNTTGYITGSTKTGTAVTVSASELVSGSETKTANGTYDVTNLASLVVNVSGGGGGGLTLIQTTSLGSLSTSSTSAADTGKTVSCASSTGWANYDLLLVDISVDTTTNGRHTSTVTPVILTGTSNVSTKNTYTVGSNKWNSKLGSTGTASTRQSTTAYGVYINAASVSSNTLTMTVYYRYNSNSTGTLNGTYTARVYGVKLIDLIGG